MSFLTPVRNYVDALVHPSARQDALTAARHRAFIAPRLLGSFAALASFPIYLALRGVPSALEVGVFAWLVAPILIAYFLSRTGRYESAHMSVFAVAHRSGRALSLVHRRHRLVRRDLAGGGSARSRALGLAPRRRAGVDLRARRRRPVLLALSAADLLPPAFEPPAQSMRPGRARHHFGGALCDRPGARRRVARAHQLLAALRRGGPLSAAGAQHDRRHHAPWPQRRRAVRLAGGGAAVRRAGRLSCSATACSTASTSPTGRPI